MATGGSLIGALRVTLGLDSSQFEAGTKRARQIAQRDVSAIQKTLSGVTKAFKGLVALSAATGLVAAAKRALDYASSLAEVSQQLGVTTRDLQVYRYVASQVGIEQSEMDKGLQRLTRSIGEAAEGAKKPAAAFRELAVAVQDSSGRLYTAGEVIPRLADALSKIEEPAKRARLETALLGKSGQQLDTMFTEGAKGIQAYADEAEKLGLIMGDELIQKADAAADRLTVLSKVLEVELASTVAENAEGILTFANAFLALVSGIGDAISWLRKFGHEARQAINAAQGWTPFGGRASGEAGYRARARYFSEGVAWDDEERRRKEMGNTARGAKLRKDGDLPAPSGGAGRKKNPPKDRTEENEARYQDDLGRLRVEYIRAYADLTGSIQLQYDADMAALAESRASFDRETKLDKNLTDAKRAELTAQREKVDAVERQAIEAARQGAEDKEAFAHTRASNEAAQEIARAELESARTADQRREGQLRLLELQKRLEEAQLKLVIATEKTGSEAYSQAQLGLQTLDQRYGMMAGLIRRDSVGPMEAYLDSLPRTADDLKERFESIKVDALNNSLDLASRNIVKLKGVAGDLFNQLISDVIRLNLQSALTAGGSGLLGSLGKMLGLASATSGAIPGSAGGMDMRGWDGSIPGMAGGGRQRIGGIPGTDRNVLAINGIPRARVSADESFSVHRGGGDSGGGSGIVRIILDSELLQAMIVSGSVEVVKAAAPSIQQGAIAGTVAEMSRRHI